MRGGRWIESPARPEKDVVRKADLDYKVRVYSDDDHLRIRGSCLVTKVTVPRISKREPGVESLHVTYTSSRLFGNFTITIRHTVVTFLIILRCNIACHKPRLVFSCVACI